MRGLELSADDYIVKPFSATELLARVRAVLRRSKKNVVSSKDAIFRHGSLTIDFARAEVFVKGKMVYLSATEYRLLLQLGHNLGGAARRP